MNYISYSSFIFLLLLLLTACIVPPKAKGFFTKPRINAGPSNSLLRKDGAYWAIYERKDTLAPGDGKDFGCFFFYDNGIALWYDASGYNEQNETDPEVLKNTIHKLVRYENDRLKNGKPAGGFLLDSTVMTIQIFRYTKYRWELCHFKGRRINDTTICIDQCQIEKSKDYCREKFYLRFLKMEKPDSTNWLMKKSWYWQKDQ